MVVLPSDLGASFLALEVILTEWEELAKWPELLVLLVVVSGGALADGSVTMTSLKSLSSSDRRFPRRGRIRPTD